MRTLSSLIIPAVFVVAACAVGGYTPSANAETYTLTFAAPDNDNGSVGLPALNLLSGGSGQLTIPGSTPIVNSFSGIPTSLSATIDSIQFTFTATTPDVYYFNYSGSSASSALGAANSDPVSFGSFGTVDLSLQGTRYEVDETNGTYLFAGNFSISPAVPESSTWGMMVIGFAGIGALTYRRRRLVRVAA